jgi:hypothetical protein
MRGEREKKSSGIQAFRLTGTDSVRAPIVSAGRRYKKRKRRGKVVPR